MFVQNKVAWGKVRKIVAGKQGAIASFDVCLLLSALMRLKLHLRQSLPTSEYLIVMYVHTTKAASLLEISSRRLRQLLQQGRVKGAYKSGKYWLIPLHSGLPQIIKARRGQVGTWKMGKQPKKTIVHINSNTIKQNIKKKRSHREPVIAIKGTKKSYVHQLEIPAPCRIVYEPDNREHVNFVRTKILLCQKSVIKICTSMF